MATAHFTYFKGRGHGERVRIALAAASIQYTESFLTAPGDMDAIRSKCLFNQCPLLEIDGLALTQSWSIVRYLGAKNGLTPAIPALAFRADCCGEQIRDFTVAGDFVGLGWAPDYFTSERVREAGRAKMQGACSSYLPRFERILEAGFLTSSEPCWADFQLLYLLNYSCEVLGEGVLSPSYPRLAALRSCLNADPRMVAHSAQHAQGLVTPTYMHEVKHAQEPLKA